MEVAALIAWVITALGGFVLLGTWISRGGTRQGGDAAPSRFPPGLIFGHFLLAATGLVLWIVYLVTDSSALAWVSLAILVVVALLGFTMAARWLQDRRAPVAAGGRVAAVTGGQVLVNEVVGDEVNPAAQVGDQMALAMPR